MGKSKESTEAERFFTLVELLVIIAIIAILAAFLMPALHKARDKSWTSACIGNLRQSATAVVFYADDYDSFRPAIYDSDAVHWGTKLTNLNYLPKNNKTKSVLLCPKLKSDLITKFDYTYGMVRQAPYFNNTADSYQADRTYRYSLSLCPTEDILIGDSMQCGNAAAAAYRKQTYEIHKYADTTNLRSLHLRHAGRANAAFYDGHVSSLSSGEVRVLRPWHDGSLKPTPGVFKIAREDLSLISWSAD